MGKREKKQGRRQRSTHRAADYYYTEQEEHQDGHIEIEQLSLSDNNNDDDDDDEQELNEEDEEKEEEEEITNEKYDDVPSKFHLYQQSVQSPKGDISYLQKFFLMYVGGRQPLHFQEDFCGTALLSTEWLRSDSRRTAVGVDLDVEALEWCLHNNIDKVGADGLSRISLFHGNVLQPLESKLVNIESGKLRKDMMLKGKEGASVIDTVEVASESVSKYMKEVTLPGRDIVCAFNYSCCCLHKRSELVVYFKNVLRVLSKRGGIFAMDLYGGVSSEQKLRLQRKFPNFTYVWEQAEFDIIERKTRISLHFHLQKQQKKFRHAFSYSWRLWSLPEIKDCMEEAGFSSVHFWLRQMPDTEDMSSTVGFGVGRDIKYEEVTSFQQQDAWNAYIVGVAK